MSVLRRLVNLWRGDTLDHEFDEEIAFHLDARIEKNRRAGLDPAAADAEARRHFGSTLRAREGMREARTAAWLPAFVTDAWVAARALRRQPAMAALAVLTLSLGIGANAAVFALVEGTLLRPLPYADPDRLVALVDTSGTGPARTSPTIPEFLDVRGAATTLQSIAFVDVRDYQLGGGTEPARVVCARSEASFLGTLGVRPALGRLFVDDDGQPGATPVAILTDRLWRANFNADPAIVGRQIVLNGESREVVGVLPRGFQFDFLAADPVGIYIPFPMIPVYTSRTAEFAAARRVMVVGRVRPEVSVEQVDAEVQAIGRGIASAHPALNPSGADRRDAGFTMRAEPLQYNLFGRTRQTMGLMSAAVALLLAIGCVNMAQFLLARALERRAELAVRSAVGATRGRLARQLAAESFVLAAVASGAGLVQAALLVRLLRAQVMAQDPFVASRIELNGYVVLFTAGIAVVAAAVCNVLPVIRMARTLPLHALNTRDVAPRTGARHLMMAGQVAVTVTLLGVAGLLWHSMARLEAGDRGFVPDDITAFRLRAPERVEGSAVGRLYEDYLDRIRSVPGIAAAAMASTPVAAFPGSYFSTGREATDANGPSTQLASYVMVSPGYFETLGIPLRAGRAFIATDAAGALPVAIVNDELVRRYWPRENPIGREIRAGEGPRSAVMTIVGVVGNVRPAMQLEPMPQIYVSLLQQTEPNMVLLVRTNRGTALPVQAIKEAVWSVERDQPLFDIRPLPEMLSRRTEEPRRLAILLGSVALLAVAVSAAGMFTLVTYVSVRRQREMALRRAIGASVGNVLAHLSLPTLRWTCVGLAVGTAGAVVVGGIVRATYAGVVPADPILLAVAGGLYLLVAAAALCAPAIAALRSDPAVILRAE